MAGRPSYLKLIRQRSFGSLWLGQVVSQSGDAVFDVALLWYVYASTGSVTLVGVVQAAVLIPPVLVGPIAGVYSDRLNRRDLMLVSNIVQGVVTAVIAALYLLGALSFPALVLLTLALYAGAQFFRAASNALFPRLVTKEELAAANSLFSLSASANQSVTYAIGGIVLVAVGVATSITYDSVTFFFAAFMMSFVVRALGDPRASGQTERQEGHSFRREFAEGLEYIRKSSVLKELIVFAFLANFLVGGVGTVIAPFVRLNLHGDALAYGLVLASSGIGSVLGSLVVGKINFRGYVGNLLFYGLLGVGLLVAVTGLAVNVPEGMSLFLTVGIIVVAVNVSLSVMMQTTVPNELLGRISTVLGSLVMASLPFAALLFGWLGGFVSLSLLFETAGLGLVVVTAGLYVPFKELREAKY